MVAMIGMGAMGSALSKALLMKGKVTPASLLGTTAHDASARRAAEALGIRVITDNAEAARWADILILATKPQNIDRVLDDVTPCLSGDKMIISMAAATSTGYIESRVGEVPVVRVMPNTPAQILHGMSVLCAGAHALPAHIDTARAIFATVGLVEMVTGEHHMDAVTGLSGSGPAYAYIMIESLAEGGVKAGLPRALATTLAAQSLLGAAAMVLETGQHPAALKDAVTTPAGTTVDGIMELEAGGLRVALIKAVCAAADRSRALAR